MPTIEMQITIAATSPGDAARLADVVGDRLAPLVAGVAQEQAGDPDDLRPNALLPFVTVKAYFDAEEDSAEKRATLTTVIADLNLPTPKFVALEETDWSTAWQAHYRPLRVGKRFWIRPSWLDDPAPNSEDLVITLDPGMAFGTGTHATTQLCLAALEPLVTAQSTVLDLGCGSGILAIGAALLGSTTILAVDIESEAIAATVENAAINNVTLTTRQGSIDVVQRKPWDIVAANILAPILIELLDSAELMRYVAASGHLILSGLLDVQVESVTAAVMRNGGRVRKHAIQDEWAALVITHD